MTTSPQPGPTAHKRDQAIGTPDQTLQVLLVEDCITDAGLIACELARSGLHATCLRVDTAADLSAALKQRRWDLVLTDYTMPNLRAPDVFKLLRERGEDVACILVSGTASEETARAAMQLGLDDFVDKQNLSELGEVVRRCLATAKKRREWRDQPRVRFHDGRELQITNWWTDGAVLEGSRLRPGHSLDALILTDVDAAAMRLTILSCEVRALSGAELVYQSVVRLSGARDRIPIVGTGLTNAGGRLSALGGGLPAPGLGLPPEAARRAETGWGRGLALPSGP